MQVNKFWRRLLAMAACALLTVACTEVTFKEPQPVGVKHLTTIPRKLRGTYQGEDKASSKIIVEAHSYRIEKEDEPESFEEYVLSDSLVIKHYRGYYFVNMRNEAGWILRVVQRHKNGNLVLMELPQVPESDERRRTYLEELRKFAPVTQTELNGTNVYIMEPEPRQLLELIRNGYFKEVTVLRRL